MIKNVILNFKKSKLLGSSTKAHKKTKKENTFRMTVAKIRKEEINTGKRNKEQRRSKIQESLKA